MHFHLRVRLAVRLKGMEYSGPYSSKLTIWDFPGGPAVECQPASAGGEGLIPGPERPYMLWSS